MRQTMPCPPCPHSTCPHSTCPHSTCPHSTCPQPHVVRNGTLSGHQRDPGLACGAWFGETQGTPRSRLRTPVAESAQALLLVRRRGSLRAAEASTGQKYENIGPWLRRSA